MALPAGWTTTIAQNSTVSDTVRTPENEALVQSSRDAIQSTRDKIVDLYNQVGSTYAGLVNAGRQEEAASLRDAAERFARAGSQTGVSSDQRVASLQDLAGSLRVAGQMAESQIEAQGISQTLDVLRTLVGVDQGALSNAMQDAAKVVTNTSMTARSPLETQSSNRSSLRSSASRRNPLAKNRAVAADTMASAKDLAARGANENFLRQALRGTSGPSSPGVRQGWAGIGNDVPRQWGEPLVPQAPVSRQIAPYGGAAGATGAAGGASQDGLSTYTKDGVTYGLDPVSQQWKPVEQVLPATPATAAAKQTAQFANVLPTSGGSVVKEGINRLPSQWARTMNTLQPLNYLSAGYDKLANKLYGNKSQPFSVQKSPLALPNRF